MLGERGRFVVLGCELFTSSPQASYLSQSEGIDQAIKNVLGGSSHILGPHVSAFEMAFSAFVGAAEGVGVANGTDAIEIALAARGIGPGDEVVTVGLTAIATLVAIRRRGARPILIDVDPICYTLSPLRLGDALTSRVRAVIPVHLYGHPADMDAISGIIGSRDIFLLEDCAQAAGAEYHGRMAGALGDAAAFSFYPTKNLGAVGDAGAIVSSDVELAKRARLLRQYGWQTAQFSETFGWTSRLDELQAAILNVKLEVLGEKVARRRKIAERYTDAFSDLPITTPAVRANCGHAFHLYVIQTHRRDELRKALAADSIIAGIHYPFLPQQQPAWRDVEIRGDLSISEKMVERILSLPLYPEMSDNDVDRVIEAIRRFFRIKTKGDLSHDGLSLGAHRP